MVRGNRLENYSTFVLTFARGWGCDRKSDTSGNRDDKGIMILDFSLALGCLLSLAHAVFGVVS